MSETEPTVVQVTPRVQLRRLDRVVFPWAVYVDGKRVFPSYDTRVEAARAAIQVWAVRTGERKQV